VIGPMVIGHGSTTLHSQWPEHNVEVTFGGLYGDKPEAETMLIDQDW
jgi:hypothetical protein